MTARLRDTLLTLITYIAVLAIFFPIFWTVLAGFKTEGTAVAQPPVLFFTPTFDNFRDALTNAGYVGFFINSVIISVCSTLVAFVLGIPAAYALGLFPTEKTAGTLSWVLSTKMMPAVGVIIPLIIIFKQIHLFDSIPGMIVLYTAINLPLVIWMMRSFFAEIPKDLIEAARVDGAETLQILIGIAVPFVTPGLPRRRSLLDLFVERVLPRRQSGRPACLDAAGLHRGIHDERRLYFGRRCRPRRRWR